MVDSLTDGKTLQLSAYRRCVASGILGPVSAPADPWVTSWLVDLLVTTAGELTGEELLEL